MLKLQIIGFFLFCGLCASPNASGQDPRFNKSYFPKLDCKPRIGERIGDFNDVSIPFIVREIDGKYLSNGKCSILETDLIALADAPAYLTHYSAYHPEEPEFYILRGQAWFFLKEYDKALNNFCVAILYEPKDAGLHQFRAAIYLKLNEFDKAIGDFNKAIELDPENIYRYVARTQAFRAHGEPKKAIEALNDDIKRSPEIAVAYWNRGWNLGQDNQDDKALDDSIRRSN